VDVRVIAATNQNLREKVESGEFRQDLYYRLKVVEVVMPPLRDRGEDIPLLVEHFLQKIATRFGRPVPGVSEDTLRLLMAYSWPGNVRELEHAVEHAVVLSREDVISRAHLPPEVVNGAVSGAAVRIATQEGGEFSRQVVLDALRRSAWNKARAAKMLGVSQRTIYRKIKEFNLSAQGSY
jgi:transcriptional regulator with PAS, ATPase and Fis domain